VDDFSGQIHWKFALIVWILVQTGIDDWINPIPLLIGSVFPDADIRKSMIGKIIPLWLFFNHRGFTHSLCGLVVFTLPIMYFNFKWGCIFACGYLLHLMMDDTTPMGIKWKIGHKRKRIRL
jgi:membrane-bound metal-dependent hydrolase YbcI (DUF457 family)